MQKVALIGAGNRGSLYARLLGTLAPELRVSAVAEPVAMRREALASANAVPRDRQFNDWRHLLEHVPDGPTQAVIVATGDQDHVEPACAALSRGHHVLLEKPVATDVAGIRAVQQAAARAVSAGGSLTVCHVLRYDPLFRSIRRALDDRRIGELVSVYHAENVSWYHMAHSYVRGRWQNSHTSSPMILAKSCHDLDLLCWFAGSVPIQVSGTAERSIFRVERAPEGAPERCTDGCPVAGHCLYEAVRTYHDGVPIKQALAHSGGSTGAAARFMLRYPNLARKLPVLSGYRPWRKWPTSTITDTLSSAGIMEALETGPYGRCVYRSDNDQPDHLEATIRFESGIGAAFRMHGQSSEEGRSIRMDGSDGTLYARFGRINELSIHRHGERRPQVKKFRSPGIGHSTADRAMIATWVRILRDDRAPEPPSLATASHLLALAIHESSQTGQTVNMAGRWSAQP